MEQLSRLPSEILALIITGIVLLASLIFPRRYLRQSPPKPIDRPDIRPKRHIALRIQDIPITRSDSDVQKDLEKIAATDTILEQVISTLGQITLIPVTRHKACATISFHASITDSELIERLFRASAILPFQYQYDCTFYGITPLYEDKAGVQIDIIAVPGLASHAVGSWKAPGGKDIWLRDFLPEDVDGIRVLLYGYDTDLLKSESRKSIEDMGRMLLESITAFRAELKTHRPIILIGHSLGGLLIKEALVYANRSARYDLSKTCCGLLFFGVPNHGLRNEQLRNLVQGQPNESLIRDLLVDHDTEPSSFLRRISSQFAERCKGQYSVISFYELKRSPTVKRHPDGSLTKSGEKVLMVTEKSATSTGITAAVDEDNIALDADHSSLVKYGSRSCTSYLIVKERIRFLVDEGVSNFNRRPAESLSSEARRVWENLNNPPYDSFRHSSRLAKPEEGTLKWLLEEHEIVLGNTSILQSGDFVSWRDSNKPQSLLITGQPGQGKSVLSNFIVASLEQHNFPNSKILYHFCNIKIDEDLRNATSVLRSLIVQLCETRNNLFQVLPSDFVESSRLFYIASVDSLLHIFKQMLKRANYSRVYCVVDGLDVYRDGMDDLITALSTIWDCTHDSTAPIIKCICTSRPIPSVLAAWGEVPHKILRCNTDDLQIFVKSRITSLGSQFTDGMKDSIVEQVNQSVERTFLWIDVVVRKIQTIHFPTLARIKDVIANSSTDLYELYGKLVKELIEIDDSFSRALIWAIYSKRPLHYTELAEAIAIDPTRHLTNYAQYMKYRPCITPEQIYTNLGTLLDVIDNQIYPIHQSVKDFFEIEDPLKGHFPNIEARLWPAYVAMTYINLNGIPIQVSSNSRSFFSYCSEFWFAHIKSPEDIYRNEALKALIPNITDTASQKSQAWIKCSISRFIPSFMRAKLESPGQIAAEFDIGWLTQVLLDGDIEGFSDDFRNYYFSVGSKSHKNGSVLEVLLRHKSSGFTLSQNDVPGIAQTFNTNIFSLLLEKRGTDFTITEAIVKAAARNQNGKGIMELLLNKKGDEVKITEDVVKAAAGNHSGAKEVMALLLDKRGDEVKITEDVVKAAAGSYWDAKEVIALLLDRRADEVKITEDVVKVAAGSECANEVMALLLDKRGDEVRITEDVVKAAAGNNWGAKEVMALLFDKRGDEIKITEDVVKAAARSRNADKVMALLFDKRGDEVKITEDVVKAAAGSYSANKVMALLLDKRGDKVKITEDIVKAAAGNNWGAKEVMALLLDKRGDEVKITEDVVKAAAGSVSANEVMALLLDKKGDKVKITDNVVKAAIRSYWGTKVMALLLDKRGDEVKITEDVVKAAAGSDNADKVMALLLDKRGDEVKITEDVVKAAAGSGSAKGVMVLLFDKRGDEVKITEDVVKAAAGNYWRTREIVSFLLEKGAEKIIITALEAALDYGHEDVVKLLLEKGADPTAAFKDGRTPLILALHHGHIEVVKLLLEKGADLTVTDKEVWTPLHSASNNGHADVVKLLLEKGADLTIGDGSGSTLLHSSAKRGDREVVRVLCQSPHINISQQDNNGRTALFFAALRGQLTVLQLLLSASPADIRTEDRYNATPLFAASRQGHVEVASALLSNDATSFNSTDFFGRTVHFWASRTGNARLINLINHYTDSTAYPTHADEETENDIPPEQIHASNWCDVCTLDIPDDDDYYRCAICDGGDFLICMECFKFGVHCQDKTHEWSFVKNQQE